jgi:hypothetical protein
VVISLDGLTLPASIPVLADHARAGRHHRPRYARVERGTLIVEGRLSLATPAGKQVLALARDGFTFQASVGVAPGKGAVSRGPSGANGQTIDCVGGLLLIKAGELKEISLVAIGADSSTSVSIAAAHKGLAMSFEEYLRALDIDHTAASEAPQRCWPAGSARSVRASAGSRGARVADIRAAADGYPGHARCRPSPRRDKGQVGQCKGETGNTAGRPAETAAHCERTDHE